MFWQSAEHAAQAVPFGNAPSGHTLPEEVVDVGGLHCVESVGDWVKSDL